MPGNELFKGVSNADLFNAGGKLGPAVASSSKKFSLVPGNELVKGVSNTDLFNAGGKDRGFGVEIGIGRV